MLEETALVWCLLLPLCFQIDEKIQQMFKKKEREEEAGKWVRPWAYSKDSLLFLMSSQEVSCRNLDCKIYGMTLQGTSQGSQHQT